MFVELKQIPTIAVIGRRTRLGTTSERGLEWKQWFTAQAEVMVRMYCYQDYQPFYVHGVLGIFKPTLLAVAAILS